MDRDDDDRSEEEHPEGATEFAYAPPPRVPGPEQPEEHHFVDWALI